MSNDPYAPAPGGRLVVLLDPYATQLILDRHRGNTAEPLFILIHPEGMLRRTGPFMVPRWPYVLEILHVEPLIYYNCRTKRSGRMVWVQPPTFRKHDNFQIEPVRLVPHAETLKRSPPRNANARVFSIEGSFKSH